MFICGCFVRVISRSKDKTGLSLIHPSSREITIFQARALNVNYSLSPDRHLKDHSHRRIQFHWRQKDYIIVLKIPKIKEQNLIFVFLNIFDKKTIFLHSSLIQDSLFKMIVSILLPLMKDILSQSVCLINQHCEVCSHSSN